MSCRTRWQINSRRSVCEYCGHSDFSETGFCNNCGAVLVFNGEEGWDPSKEAVNIPIAINSKIDKEQCYLCGRTAENKLQDSEHNEAVSIMIKLMMMESSEMKKIKEFSTFLFDKTSPPSDNTLIKISRAIRSRNNLILPTIVNKFYYEESNFYGIKSGHICLECAWKEFESRLEKPEPEKKSLAERMSETVKRIAEEEMISPDMEGPDAPKWEKREKAVLHKPEEEWEEDWDEDWDDDWPEEYKSTPPPPPLVVQQAQQEKYYIDKNGQMRKR